MTVRSLLRLAVVGLASGVLTAATTGIAAEPAAPAAPAQAAPAAPVQAAPAAPVQAAPAAPVQAGADPVVARVNGAEIRRADVMRTIAGLPAQVRQLPVEMIFPAVVDQMINSRLVASAAASEHLQDDPEYREKLKRAEERVMQEVFLARTVKSRITDEMLKVRYEKYLRENPQQEEVRASHILVATESEAKALIAQLKAGGDFAKLAREKSTDAAAAAQGGDLGYFTRDAMVAPFADAAFAAPIGAVVPTPIHTQFGWHVIRVDDRRKAPAPTLEEMRSELEGEMSQEVVAAVVAELRSKAKVEEFTIDGQPRTGEAQPAKP